MKIVERTAEMMRLSREWLRAGRKVGFVPTMGAFHVGHVSLMQAARRECEIVVVSIFVNPLQFAAGEDFDRYPRNLPADKKIAKAEGVDVLFVPTVAEVYAKGFSTFVNQSDDGLPSKFCGPFRPGHFRGVMTVVAKLFNIVRPTVAYFGQKDYQQFLIIRRMTADLNFDIQLRMLPTVREEDGLAFSSRNAYLGPKQRRDATVLYRALQRARDMIMAGENDANRVIAEMRRMIQRVKGAKIEYIRIANQDTLEDVREIKGRIVIALAVRIGKARLIDNILLG